MVAQDVHRGFVERFGANSVPLVRFRPQDWDQPFSD